MYDPENDVGWVKYLDAKNISVTVKDDISHRNTKFNIVSGAQHTNYIVLES
jgi:hypothetical protein